MPRIAALFALGPLILSLTACLSSNVQVYNRIDATDKTITVPPGNALLVGAIKQRLRDDGWKLVVDAGPERTVGTLGEKTDLATGNTFRTRYRLILRQVQFDYCIPVGGPAIRYDLSLIDNTSGEEMIAQSGEDCRDSAAEKLISALNGTAK